MDIFLMQTVTDSTLNCFVSQNRTKVVELSFYLWKILIDAKFILFWISKKVFIKSRQISEQRLTCTLTYHFLLENSFRFELCKISEMWKVLINSKQNSGIIKCR